jgi:hypothetical protein
MMTKKSDETQTIIRLPQSLLEDMKHFAELHERSINGELVWAIRCFVEQEKKAEDKARMAAAIEQVKPLEAWRETVESGKKIYHATLPFESVGKNEQGWYVHEYDNITSAGDKPLQKFEDTLWPKFFKSFEELVASCDIRDLWSDEPTTEAFINHMRHIVQCVGHDHVFEGDIDEDETDIPEDARLTPENFAWLKEWTESALVEMREKGYKQWHRDIEAKKQEPKKEE